MTEYKYIKKINFSGVFLISVILLLLFQKSESSIEKVIEKHLAEGVVYKNCFISSGGRKHCVHIIEFDIIDNGIEIKALKAKNLIDELRKIHDIADWHDSIGKGTVIAAINANFWRAYTNYPIGPLIIDGEPVTMRNYKQWSSAFFDEKGRLFIDTFRITAELILPSGEIIELDRANHRRDSTDNVIYNRFAGGFVPRVHVRDMRKAMDEALEDAEFNDSTEHEFQFEELKEEIAETERISSEEYSYKKISLVFNEEPAINKEIECALVRIDSGSVEIPENGCVISLSPLHDYNISKINGNFILRLTTNVNKDIIFKNAVCGTPRLVRKGRAGHEAYQEGSTGRRFIRSMLPRTALGTNKEKTKIYLAAVESGSRSEGTNGANLRQLAEIMKKIGCYEAMNLDGGGSTSMLINSENAAFRNNPNHSRKISTAIAIIETSLEKNLLKDWFKE